MLVVDATGRAGQVPVETGAAFDVAMQHHEVRAFDALLSLRQLAERWPVSSAMRDVLEREIRELARVLNLHTAERCRVLATLRSQQT